MFAAFALLCLAILPARVVAEQKPLLDFGSSLSSDAVQTADARAALTAGPNGKALMVVTGREYEWPGVTLKAPGGRWDLSPFERILLDVKNVGVAKVNVQCRVDGPLSDSEPYSLDGDVSLAPGEKRTLTVELRRRAPAELAKKLIGMRGYPGGFRADAGIDVRNVKQLVVFVSKTSSSHAFEVQGVRAEGRAAAPPALPADMNKLFPLIDRYGQYIHAEWPGKTHSDDDLRRAKEQEERDLAAQPGPADRDQYGGWKAGPLLPATGFFRVEKYKGKWWLVDPEGRLFWSHGVDCVGAGFGGQTPLTGREHYFQGLPSVGATAGLPSSAGNAAGQASSGTRQHRQIEALARFYGRSNGAPLGYYKDKSFDTFCFAGANLMRKYGDDYVRQFDETAQRRLRSWALNTIGNWSDAGICKMHKTPYVASTCSGGRRLEGSAGYWGKFPDVFDPGFAAAVSKSMEAQRGFSAGDPWCIGFFIDNELGWGDDCSLAEAALASPPDQAAKKVFLADLKAKYGTIEGLTAPGALPTPPGTRCFYVGLPPSARRPATS